MTDDDARAAVLAAHPDAKIRVHCVAFGTRWFRIIVEVDRGPYARTLSGPKHRTPSAAWREAARRLKGGRPG
jgi:hypothetical protein